MSRQFTSKVEQAFYGLMPFKDLTTKIPYITVDNLLKLGLLTSLRFLEWANENPDGVISLPTGKTPEYFIKYTGFMLRHWDKIEGRQIRERYGFGEMSKPDLRGLKFVQIDEFYPINPAQHNSFYNYIRKYYIDGFGLESANSVTINSVTIPLPDEMHYREVFQDMTIDLSLRFREAKNRQEKLQQQAIFMIDNWCSQYEEKIRELGGIGFFLGGIGPDGHIAFNTRGSDLFSTTRLTKTNFETQAVAAGDLGGMEISRNRLVITIGLETITYNPDAVAIIFAAGEAKAGIVKDALEHEKENMYPASVLQRLPDSRFYLTSGAASRLNDVIKHYYTGDWNNEKTDRAVIDLCIRINKYAENLTLEDLENDEYCSCIPGLDENTVKAVISSVKEKISYGMVKQERNVIYHTGPHHDDIMLGILPMCIRQTRHPGNEVYFSVMTSGFTAVTNSFVESVLLDTLKLINEGLLQMIYYPDFFESGYDLKRGKDVYHYLNGTAQRDLSVMRRGICHRVVRALTEIWGVKSKNELITVINELLINIKSSYSGSKNPPKIQLLKGMLREYEEELVWAHFGVPVQNIHHLRLGFYTGDIFTEQPERKRDIEPVLNEFRKYKPDIIGLALDPEGSGPDTHYKVLQTIAAAVKEWQNERDISGLKVIGYRNVWYRFHPAEVNCIIPVSLNSLAVLDNSFGQCYGSQVNASFPSYEYDGKFSDLTRKIWVEQLKQIQLILGKEFFFLNEHPLLRSTHGLVYAKVMDTDEFITLAGELESAMEGVVFD